ncbi:hypothetical protein MMYC01_204824 [Madurella mycetomatis]|uniref:Uncharacterized protein n=1 Tax=Madurella mycetomatis TaxID=100816 RepID=A0A175W6U3_9PEZI|nr:hypothetical protein MMYC01_207247 [Madurella mycetomatis]KXX79181.1 hypothetical protein MMYC01_204824 [Madurella mycetomatis]
MGLFSFLSMKPGGKVKNKSSLSLKPYAYDSAATQSLSTQSEANVDRIASPVDMGLRDTGTYLVLGNGTNVLDSLFKESQSFSQSQGSLDVVPIDDVAAPAPGVPLYREEGTERPRTAPTGRPPSSGFANRVSPPKKGPRVPPPLSFRMTRLGTEAPRSRPASRGSVTAASSAHHLRSRTSSIRSDSGMQYEGTCLEIRPSDSGTKYKDILDAQSEIKPADFRGRVRASGARDYGEDVADRNIARDAFDHESLPARILSGPSNKNRPDNDMDSLAKDISMAGPGAVRFRTKGPHLFAQHPLPKHKSSARTMPSDIEAVHGLGRRRSISTYLPVSSLKGKGSLTQEQNPRSFGDVRPGLGTAEAKGKLSPPTAKGAAAGPMQPRDSVILAKKKVGAEASDDGDVDRSSDGKLLRSTARLSAIGSSNSVHHQRHSSHTVQSSVSSSIASRDTIAHATALAHPRSISRPHQTWEEASTTSAKASSPIGPVDEILEHSPRLQTRSVRGWSASSGAPTTSDSTTITTTTTTTSAGSEFHHSRPSASLHTADTSVVDLPASAISPLLKPLKPLLKPSHSRSLKVTIPHRSDEDSDDDGDGRDSASFYAHDDALFSYQPPASPNNHNSFNIDDYLSADDESLSGEGRQRSADGQDEEDLLFNDAGYGMEGLQLPGLADPFPSTDGLDAREESEGRGLRLAGSSLGPGMFMFDQAFYQGSDDEEEEDEDEEDDGRVGASLRRVGWAGRRYVLDTAADDGDYCYYGEDESREGGDDKIKMAVTNTTTLSALWLSPMEEEHGSMPREEQDQQHNHQPERQQQRQKEGAEETKEDGPAKAAVDVAAAVRLRKQVKRAQRMAGTAGQSSSSASRLQRLRSMRASMPALRVGNDDGDGN